MFMFTFSVITISIVGLFFQIVSAITAYFMSQQVGLGEQMLKWHSIAFADKCSMTKADGEAITDADFDTRAAEVAGQCGVGGCTWHTEFFTGTYDSAPARMIVTYVRPDDRPSGFSASDVARQLQKVTIKQRYRFSRASGGATQFTTYDSSTGVPPHSIPITGMPFTSGKVVDNSVVLVSDATCP